MDACIKCGKELHPSKLYGARCEDCYAEAAGNAEQKAPSRDGMQRSINSANSQVPWQRTGGAKTR